MFEKVLNFFMVCIMLVIVICLMAISWSMWQPALTTQKSMTEVAKVLKGHDEVLKVLLQERNDLRKVSPLPKAEPKKK